MRSRITTIFIHLFWIVLIFFSIIYAQERTFADAGAYLFKVINQVSFDVQHSRSVLAISQVAGLIATIADIGLHKIIVIDSLWNCLTFYGVVIWLVHVIKDYKAAYLLTFLLTAHYLAYFSPFLEVFYGCAFLILFVSANNNQQHFEKYAIGYYVLLWLALFSHPLVMGAYLFYIVILFVENKTFTLQLKKLMLFFCCSLFIKILIVNPYESGRYITTFNTSLNEYIELYKNLLQVLIKYSKPIVLLFLGTISLLIYQRKYSFAFLSFFGYIGLISLVVYNVNSSEYRWYNDVLNVPALLLLIIPLVFVFSSKESHGINKYGLPFLALLLIMNLFSIHSASHLLKMRYTQMQSICSEAKDLYPNQSKFRIDDKNFEKGFSVVDLFLPYFSMMTSSEFGNINTIVLAENEMMKYDSVKDALKPNKVLMWEDYIEDISFYNANYFKINIGEYAYLNAAEYDGNLNRIITNTSLEILESPEKAEPSEIVYPLLKLSIDSGIVFPSNARHQFYISYHVYDKEGNTIEWDGLRNFVEMDFKYNFEQRIEVKVPNQAGEYRIEIDLVKEGEAWFQKPVSFKLKVD
jgi:hypothetical protein